MAVASTFIYEMYVLIGRGGGGYRRGRDERDGGFERDRFGGPSEADTADSWERGPPR